MVENISRAQGKCFLIGQTFSTKYILLLSFSTHSDLTKMLAARNQGIFRLRLHDDGLNRRRKSGVASPLFNLRLDKRFREEICVHMVTQKCVEFDWVCMSGG